MCNIFSIHALSGFTLCANHMHIFRNVVPDANQLFHKYINKWIKINKSINQYVDKQNRFSLFRFYYPAQEKKNNISTIFYIKRYFCAHSSGNDGTSSDQKYPGSRGPFSKYLI